MEEEKEDEKLPIRQVEIASTNALRFVEQVADVFMKHVMRLDDYLITDETMIYDFGPWHDDQEMEDFERQIITRTRDIFGVDITPVIEKKLPEILLFLQKERRSPGFTLGEMPPDDPVNPL